LNANPDYIHEHNAHDNSFFGINAGYTTSLNDVYGVNHTNIDNNSLLSQDLKRKFVTFGLQFTPKK